MNARPRIVVSSKGLIEQELMIENWYVTEDEWQAFKSLNGAQPNDFIHSRVYAGKLVQKAQKSEREILNLYSYNLNRLKNGINSHEPASLAISCFTGQLIQYACRFWRLYYDISPSNTHHTAYISSSLHNSINRAPVCFNTFNVRQHIRPYKQWQIRTDVKRETVHCMLDPYTW